jgi:hypothetical protein
MKITRKIVAALRCGSDGRARDWSEAASGLIHDRVDRVAVAQEPATKRQIQTEIRFSRRDQADASEHQDHARCGTHRRLAQ